MSYDTYMRDAYKCLNYERCLLCHGCRAYATYMMKCTKCSMNPHMICKHNDSNIAHAFHTLYQGERPVIDLSEDNTI